MIKRRKRGRPAHEDVLTPTEWRVTHAIQHGLSNRDVAERRGISRDGVKYHVANVLAKLHLPHRKALQQWFRVPRHSALNRGEMTTMGTSKLGAIGQIARHVGDIQQAVRWYGDVLGLPHLYTFGNMAFFDCNGTRLLLTQEAQPPGADSIIYFRVDDIAQTYEGLKAKGVEFINAPHMIHKHSDGTEEWMGFFKDPDSRPLAIMSQVAP
jgi:DNA-binding CsgD family transcriptional regulator/catechol 2,3-dioxygenase-like lactoylglutathione lyase family enzyme